MSDLTKRWAVNILQQVEQTPVKVFFVSFFFVLVAGALLQFIVLPMSPWHAGSGLMAGGDWVWFHKLAVKVATQIRQSGWSHWGLRVNGQAPVSVAAAFYAFTGINKPWVLLPLHGTLYGISAVSLYSIAQSLNASRRLSLCLLFPLFLFPSSAMIWGQIHKDIYSLAGLLLILRFWTKLWRSCAERSQLPKSQVAIELLAMTLGMSLVIFVRPYLGHIVILASAAVGIVLLVSCIIFSLCSAASVKNIANFNLRYVFSMVFLAIFLQFAMIKIDGGSVGGPIQVKKLDSTEMQRVSKRTKISEKAQSIVCLTGRVSWSSSTYLPAIIDQRLASLACVRESFRHGTTGAGSNIDADIGFGSMRDIMLYLPRALQIAFFSPFPDQWFAKSVQAGGGAMRLLVIPEMLLLYLALPGIILACFVSEIRVTVMIALLFSVIVVLLYVLVITNMGTLYRLRFPVMLIWILLGGVGWSAWFNRYRLNVS